MNKSKILKDLLTGEETLVMPDAYDPVSARIIEQAGFKAVQCSGYSFSVAACRKTELDITLAENLALTEAIVKAVGESVFGGRRGPDFCNGGGDAGRGARAGLRGSAGR